MLCCWLCGCSSLHLIRNKTGMGYGCIRYHHHNNHRTTTARSKLHQRLKKVFYPKEAQAFSLNSSLLPPSFRFLFYLSECVSSNAICLAATLSLNFLIFPTFFTFFSPLFPSGPLLTSSVRFFSLFYFLFLC